MGKVVFSSGYKWGTDFNRVQFIEKRDVEVSQGVPESVLYSYQLLTQADLQHMVAYNAFSQGEMLEDDFERILNTTVNTLRKSVRGVKEARDMGLKEYESMIGIYRRLRKELEEEGILEGK